MSATAAAFTAVLIGLLMLLPGVAHAANEVVTSEPADGTTLATSPTQIVINFTEEIGELRIVSLECNTEPINLPAPTLSGNSRVMTVEIPEALPRGLCVATWRVSDSDGEPNGSSLISFTVDAEPAATTTPADEGATTSSVGSADGSTPVASTSATTSTGDADTQTVALNRVETGTGPLWLGRVLSTLGIAAVFGALVLIAAAWPEGVEYLITVRFLRAAWVLALIGTLLFTSAAAAAVTGSSLGSGFNPGAWFDLLGAGWAGSAALFRLVFVIASAWVAFRPDRVLDPVTQVAALGIPALAVAMIGIGRVDGSLAALGVLLGVAHALAMAIWVGGVILLTRVVLSGPGDEDLVHAVRGFARISIIAIDVMTGLYAFQVVAPALYLRSRTGEGQYLDVPLAGAASAFQAGKMIEYQLEGSEPAVLGAPVGTFQTKDGFINMNARRDAHFAALCDMLSLPEWKTDPRFASQQLRIENEAPLMVVIRPLMLAKTSAEWLALLEKADILAAKVNDYGDLFEDAQVKAVEQVVWLDQKGFADPLPVPQIPGQPKIEPGSFLAHVPVPGEQTDEILAEIGFDADRIAALRADKAIV